MGISTLLSSEVIPDVTDVMKTSVTGISDNIMSMTGQVLPIAMGIVGLGLAIFFGIKFIRRTIK